jgi:hypothetical protein
MKFTGYVLLGTTLSALLGALGCGHPVQRQLQGRWFGETIENVPADQIAITTAWARGTTFEFTGSNVTVTVPAQNPRTAPYQIVKATRRGATLAFQGANGASNQAALSFDADDLMRLHVNDRQAIVLRREH